MVKKERVVLATTKTSFIRCFISFFFYVLLLNKKVNVCVLCMMRVTDVEIGLWLKDPLTILFFSFMLRNITVKRKPKVF